MQKILVGLIFILTIVAFSSSKSTKEIEKKELYYPNPTNYVVDTAGVIGDEVEAELNTKLASISSKAEIAVVTVKTTQPLGEASYAINLANKWGVGDKQKDNGILFLIVTEDRKLRIEVGSGAEAFMNDAKAGRILDTYVVPELKNNNWEKGIINGTEAIIKEVK